ncbi:hypothetical protein K504DRAFT_13057 [Pleomassaria siparia CBS 279.74]|uniref:Uncharacterized protein n=1 Tax=Pleomassaria siparia CBS 279.74 TaxID=1314801 RepID=A0A6G1KQJ3_9PLEO|nr:hypothetical protein K504DRAFT_13057 [Pleomassaria siparia CBS 279.74]
MILAQNTIHVTHTETVTVGCSTRSNYRRGGPTFGRLPPAPTGRVPRSPSESAINFPTSTLTEPSNATAQFKNAGTSSSKSTHTKGPKLMLNLYANMTIDRIQELILDLTTDLQVVEARVKDLKCKWTPAKAQYDETNESLAPANKGSKYLETKKAYHTEMVSDDKSLSGDQKKLLDSVGWKIEDIRRAIQDSKIVQANVQANVHHIEAKVALNLEKGHKLRKDIASVEKFLATLSKNIAKTADAVLGDDDE